MHRLFIGAALCLLLLAGQSTPAASEANSGLLSAQWDNDALTTGHDDRHYTNGFHLAYLSGENRVPALARGLARLLPLLDDAASLRAGLALGQNIYTPEKIFEPDPPPDDRPYAGWLYASAGLLADDGRHFDVFELSLGLVGPHARGKEVQRWMHRQFGTPPPKGWDHQLADEFAILLTAERKWRTRAARVVVPLAGTLRADLRPYAGLALGNVLVQGSGGGVLRLGNDLAFDDGPIGMRPGHCFAGLFDPSPKLHWYLFAGTGVDAVLHNIFLDGNTLVQSPSVDKRFLVADLQTGLAATLGPFHGNFTTVWRSAEFKGQNGVDTFGSLALSVSF